MLPTGTRVKHFTAGDALNTWLEEKEGSLEVHDIKVTSYQAYNWNREEYGWPRTIYVVIYSPAR